MVAGVVTVHDAERILGTMESMRPVTPLCAMHYRAFQKQLLRAKASVRRPHQIIHLFSCLVDLSCWVCCPCNGSYQGAGTFLGDLDGC